MRQPSCFAALHSASPLRAVLQIGENDRALLADACIERVVELLDEDVDLAAAGKTDLERLIVRDPVREQLRPRAAEDRPACLIDVGLDTTAADAAAHLARLGHDELRADGAGRRTPSGDDRR